MRPLKENEIQCRVQVVKQKGFSVLLYKDARCDMNILDETYGEFGWKRTYEKIGSSLFCTISVWDKEKSQWVQKQDVGSESNMDAEKGQASDAFKRAGFNWGIGRELYTAPFIWINAQEGDVKKGKDGKLRVKCNLRVDEINTVDGHIKYLRIVDDKGKPRFTTGKSTNSKPVLNSSKPKWEDVVHKVATGTDITTVKKHYTLSEKDAEKLIAEAMEFKNEQ